MRILDGRLRGIGAVSLILAAGCAGSAQKPCMIIPAQIELARDVRDQAQKNLDDKQAELARIKSNLEQSKLHMARLIEERDQLKKEVGGTAGQQQSQSQPKPGQQQTGQPTGQQPTGQQTGQQQPGQQQPGQQQGAPQNPAPPAQEGQK